MTLTNVIVGLQAASFGVLAVIFASTGHWRLAVAQVCYVISTLVIFGQ